jgi:hypothetical protein
MTSFKKSPNKQGLTDSETVDGHAHRTRTTWRVLGGAIGLLLLLSGWSQHQFDYNLIRGHGVTEAEESAPGTVKWWKCEGADDVPGAECGYVMHVLHVPSYLVHLLTLPFATFY